MSRNNKSLRSINKTVNLNNQNTENQADSSFEVFERLYSL